MKINEIIRKRRLEKGLTQEQTAGYLGVTASAVNKWEKGASYPDITLLPALARLLDTDLNTLLSFKDELTDKEVGAFLNHLAETLESRGFAETYNIALEKIKEYPNCAPLILNVALFLDGSLGMDQGIETGRDEYLSGIEALYQRAAESQDSAIRTQAQSVLISRFMGRKEFDKAEELLQLLPDKSPVDKKQIQANLFIEYGKLEEASRLEEEKLLSAVNDIQMTLIKMMEIAIKEERQEDAEYIADVCRDSAKLFDLWEYNSYVAHFGLYLACKNYLKCVKIFVPMMKSLLQKWDIKGSPLYRHIKTKEVGNDFGIKMQKNIIKTIYSDEEASFLQENKEVQAFAKKLDLDGGEN